MKGYFINFIMHKIYDYDSFEYRENLPLIYTRIYIIFSTDSSLRFEHHIIIYYSGKIKLMPKSVNELFFQF